MNKKRFWRFHDTSGKGQGLWYSIGGVFINRIQQEFSFCKASSMSMEFDPEMVGWLSATESLEVLFQWFSREEILKLQESGFRVVIFEATEYRQYNGHWLIKQGSSVIAETVVLDV